jgi:hypothetical protein
LGELEHQVGDHHEAAERNERNRPSFHDG